jgi:hypothetical protein
MTVTLYQSDDASAPALTGETGSLNLLLDAILVDGYGAKPAAGWSKTHSDATTKTNVYRPGAGPRHYLQSADAGPGGGSFREARWRGYVSMSAYDTGTEPFPTVAQMTNGLFVRKSATLDATARTWVALADDASLILFLDPGDSSAFGDWYFFGRFTSWKNSDDYASFISGRIAENSNSYTSAQSPHGYSGPKNQSFVAGYAPRSYSGTGTAVALYKTYNAGIVLDDTTTADGTAGVAYPNPVDGGLLLSPLYLAETGAVRGTIPGLWSCLHAKPLLNGDSFSALDGAVTRSFLARNTHTAAQYFAETTDTWETP